MEWELSLSAYLFSMITSKKPYASKKVTNIAVLSLDISSTIKEFCHLSFFKTYNENTSF